MLIQSFLFQAFSLQGTLVEGAAFAASNLRFKSCRKDSVESCASLELSHFSLGGKTAAQRLMLQRFQQKDWVRRLGEEGFSVCLCFEDVGFSVWGDFSACVIVLVCARVLYARNDCVSVCMCMCALC